MKSLLAVLCVVVAFVVCVPTIAVLIVLVARAALHRRNVSLVPCVACSR